MGLNHIIVKEINIEKSRVLCVPLYEVFEEVRDDIINNNAKKIAVFKGQN